MTSAFVFPRTRVLAVAVAAALAALVAWQVIGARPANNAGAAAGGVHITMTVTGPNGTLFKGDDGATARAGANIITVLAYSYALQNTMTIGSAGGGAGEGKAVHKPVTITHVMGGSSPQFLFAAATGERLPKVEIDFFRIANTGKETVYYRVTLTNAFVSEVAQRSTGDNVLEDVSFIFEKIEQKSLVANTDFTANVVTGAA
jgi:type VI secretion system Hcp family effector